MFKTQLLNYAKLLVRVGLNVQKKQEVIIVTALEQLEFVAMVVKECYLAGASKVRVEWKHQPIDKLHAIYQIEEDLAKVKEWQCKKLEMQTYILPAKLYLDSDAPDGMAGIDVEKYTNAMARRAKVIKPYRDKMENRYQWCIAAVPSKAWAKQVFAAEKYTAKLEEKLWIAILNCARCIEGNPLANWEKHNAELARRTQKLNAMQIKALHYSSKNGTDFSISLLEKSRFLAGEERTIAGTIFNPNIPSEECFTTPDRYSANGILYATKPLSYRGQRIQDFYLEFKDGKVIKAKAKVGDDMLQQMLLMDAGASYLGEVALVSKRSPINRSGLLFYNTLLDENASCHFALGRGYTNCIEGYTNMTEQELHVMGVNDSIEHTDFMVGSEDLSIIAKTKENKMIQIFENGDWAYSIEEEI